MFIIKLLGELQILKDKMKAILEDMRFLQAIKLFKPHGYVTTREELEQHRSERYEAVKRHRGIVRTDDGTTYYRFAEGIFLELPRINHRDKYVEFPSKDVTILVSPKEAISTEELFRTMVEALRIAREKR